MADPVKTILMDAIKTALEGITLIKQVKRGQAIPIDEETAVYSWTSFFDETETKANRNRLAMKEFDLVIQVWVKEKVGITLDEQLDLMDAEIEKTLLTDVGVMAATLRIDPVSAEKLYVDDGVRAILQAIYHIQYAHAWKDPYNPAK